MKYFGLTILLFFVVICPGCSNENRYERYRKEHFVSTFDYPIAEVLNFRGKSSMADLPRGTMFLESYQFEAQVQLKIRNENTYKKAEAGKVIDFLENKTLVDTSELQLLRLKREELDVWESKKSWPAYDSGSNKVIMHSTATTWIIYLPVATHRYVVVKVQQDEDVP